MMKLVKGGCMGLFAWLSGWHESGSYRFRHGVNVRILGKFPDALEYAGCIGRVVGLGMSTYFYGVNLGRRFVVDLGGMAVEVPGGDLELVKAAPKDVSASSWQ
jgi:hypothetical protein